MVYGIFTLFDPLNISVHELRSLCISNDWFCSGTNAQYEKLFWAQKEGASIAELALIIWLCSEGVLLRDTQRTLEKLTVSQSEDRNARPWDLHCLATKEFDEKVLNTTKEEP